MSRRLPAALYLFATVGILAGVLVSTLRSAERPSWTSSLFPELEQLARLEPIRVLPHVEMSLVAMEARRAMDSGRPWQAWRILSEHVDSPDAIASHVLLAARAATQWEAWDHVEEALEGREWLARAENGEGLYLLARAREELGRETEAAEAYARYAALPSARYAGAALARLGSVLGAQGDPAAAARAFDRASASLPEIADWLRTLQIEQLAAAGTPLPVSLATTSSPLSAPVRLRRVQAEVAVRRGADDLAGALRKLEWEERILRAQAAVAEASRLQVDRARLLMEQVRQEEARPLLRAAARETGAPPATRAEAADALGEIGTNGAQDELARAAAYEAAAKPGLAARSVRAAIATGAPGAAGLRLQLARLLYAARDYGPARTAFQQAAEELTEPELAAEASLYAARSLYRAGTRSRSAALTEMKRVAERHPGTAAAGSALFLLGDAAPSLSEALGYYRRAAAVTHSPDAREALSRVGDRSLKLKDTAGAISAWEGYVARYPQGEPTVRVAYETGRLHEKAGRQDRAKAMYQAALAADPISYYAFRAGNRLGVHPIDAIIAEPRPWVGLASDPAAAQGILRRLDVLTEAGLDQEWSEELASARRALRTRPAALLAVAEGIRDRGYPVEAIRVGYQLLEARDGEWDPRLLRVVFPFIHRELIETESDRVDVDPMLLAGLIRQESSFRHDARSWVGATGLSQIMPSTGSWLASTLGIREFEQRLLTVPEVNVRMGARYLRDQLRSYDGARDLALAAYNAGPGRATRWRRTLGYGGDTDAFREAIPFDETRQYVKLVLRNAALYSRLYAEERPVGLVPADDR
jgi:soluble lytic murein transglycosylase